MFPGGINTCKKSTKQGWKMSGSNSSTAARKLLQKLFAGNFFVPQEILTLLTKINQFTELS